MMDRSDCMSLKRGIVVPMFVFIGLGIHLLLARLGQSGGDFIKVLAVPPLWHNLFLGSSSHYPIRIWTFNGVVDD